MSSGLTRSSEDDGAGGTGAPGTGYPTFELPDASYLLHGELEQNGFDLIITNPAGETIVVPDYFSFDPPPNLVIASGAGLSPEMVQSLMPRRFGDDIQFAGPASSPALAVKIGTVTIAIGDVRVRHADGTEEKLSRGDDLYKGDVILTGSGRAFVKAKMLDGTRFHLGRDGEAVLDDFEFDEAARVGHFEAFVRVGGFHYKSGKIGELRPNSLQSHSTIKTPSAVIGIRGSELDGTVDQSGQTIVVHRSGYLVISDINEQNPVVLASPEHTAVIVLNGSPQFSSQPSPQQLQFLNASLPPPDTGTNGDEQDDAGTEESGDTETEGETGSVGTDGEETASESEEGGDGTAEEDTGEEDTGEEDTGEEDTGEEDTGDDGAGEESGGEESSGDEPAGADAADTGSGEAGDAADDSAGEALSGESGDDQEASGDDEPASDDEATGADREAAGDDAGSDQDGSDSQEEQDTGEPAGQGGEETAAAAGEEVAGTGESTGQEEGVTRSAETSADAAGDAGSDTGDDGATGRDAGTDTSVEDSAESGETGGETGAESGQESDVASTDTGSSPDSGESTGPALSESGVFQSTDVIDPAGQLDIFSDTSDTFSDEGGLEGGEEDAGIGSGIEGESGEDTGSARAATEEQVVELLIGNNPPEAQGFSDRIAIEGLPFGLPISSSSFVDPDGDRLTFRATGLPPGLTFDAATETILGTPSEPGESIVTVEARDPFGAFASTTFRLTVLGQGDAGSGNIPPVLSRPIFNQTITVGEEIRFTIPDNTFVDINGDEIRYSVDGLPDGVFFSSEDNSISGIPADSSLGLHTVTVQAFDPGGGRAFDEFVVDVIAPVIGENNDPELSVPLFDQQAVEGEPFSFVIPEETFVDVDGDPLSFTLEGLPEGFSFDQETRTISGTPDAEVVGSHTVQIIAADSRGGQADDEFVLDILSATEDADNLPPRLVAPVFDQIAEVDVPFRLDVSDVFEDLDGDVLSFAVRGLPTGLFFDETTSSIVGFPTELDTGSYNIEIVAFDGNGGRASDEFFLDVILEQNTTGNLPPVLILPLIDQRISIGDLFRLTLDDIFEDPDGDPLSFAVAGLPTSLFLNPDTNTIVGTPTIGDLGSFVIEVTAFDGEGGSTFNRFFLDVLPAGAVSEENNDPVLIAPLFDLTVEVGTPVSSSIADRFEDPDGDELTFAVSGLPTSLVLDPLTNTVIGTPTTADVGSYVVEVSAFDGRGGSDAEEFLVTVLAPGVSEGNSDPLLVAPFLDQTLETGDSVLVRLDDHFLDPDADPLEFVVTGLPPGLFLDPTSNAVVGTLTSLDVGSYVIGVAATDGRGGTAFDELILDVVPAGVAAENSDPFLVLPPLGVQVAVGEQVLIDLQGTFDDPDGDPLEFVVSGLPPGLFLDEATQSITGSATDLDVGTHIIEVSAFDGRGGSDSVEFLLDILPGGVQQGNTDPALVLPFLDRRLEVGDEVFVDVAGHFNDVDGDTLSFAVSGLPPSLFFDPVTNAVIGTIAPVDLGSYVIEITVSDGRGGTAFDELFLDIVAPGASVGNSDPFLAQPLTDQQFLINQPVRIPLDGTFADADGDPLVYAVSGLPPGLFVDASNVVTGIPTDADVGAFLIEVGVSDGRGGFDFTQFFLSILPDSGAGGNTAPVLVTPFFDELVETGTDVFFQVAGHFSDPDGDPLGFAVSGLPPSLFFDPASQAVVGTLTSIDVGSYVIEIAVADGRGGNLIEQFFLDVVPPGSGVGNGNPFLSLPLIDVQFEVGQPVQIPLEGTFLDPDGDPLDYVVSGLPPGLFVNAANEIVGLPTDGDVGAFLIEVAVSDGRGGSDFTDFFLGISPAGAATGNSPPVIILPFIDRSIEAGNDVFVDVAGHFEDPDGDLLGFAVSGLPPSLFFDSLNNAVVGTLTDIDVGSYVIQVAATDGNGGNVFDEFFLDIIPAGGISGNGNPFLNLPLPDVLFEEGQLVQIPLDGTFADPDGDPLSYAVSGLPPSLFVDAGNVITGVPGPADIGTFAIQVAVSDGRGGTDFTGFFLDIASVGGAGGNSAPVVILPFADQFVQEGLVVNFDVASHFADPDGDPLSYAVNGLPPSLLFDPAQAAVVGTLTSADIGTFVIQVAASDGLGGTVFDEFFLDIAASGGAANAAPILLSPLSDTLVEEGVGVFIPLDPAFSDPDGDLLTFAVSGLPPSLLLDPVTNAIVGTPTASDLGTFVIDVAVFDGQGGNATDQFFLDVVPAGTIVNSPPTGSVDIIGSLVEGQVLTADTGTLADADGLGALSFQWFIDGIPLAGETFSTLVLAVGDAGGVVTVTVDYIDGQGNPESVSSLPSAPVAVAPVNSPASGLPVILGIAEEGQSLSVDTLPVTDADGLGTFSYQWFRNGAPIPGETAPVFSVTAVDVGSSLSVGVSFVDGGGTFESLISVPTPTVLAAGSGNTPPELISPAFDAIVVNNGDAVDLVLEFADLDGDLLTITTSGLPPWLVATTTTTTSTFVNLSGSATTTATSNVIVNADDSFGGTSLPFTINVTAPGGTLLGTPLDDLFFSSPGADAIDGDTGFDTIFISGLQSDFSVSAILSGGFITVTFTDTNPGDGDNGTDQLTRLESVVFSDGPFSTPLSFAGSTGPDTLIGLDGNDALIGLAGNDVIFGANGNDTLDGGLGADIVDGGMGADTLVGGTGTDTLTGGPGNDLIDGNVAGTTDDDAQIDTAVFSGNSFDYSITQTGTGSAAVYTVTDLNPGDGDDGVDTISDVEVLQFADTAIDLPYFLVGGFSADVLTGGSQGDSLIGAAATDTLLGLGGDDLLDGGGQDDILDGGAGFDTLIGGDGADLLTGGPGDDVIDGNILGDTTDDLSVDTAIFSGNSFDYSITQTGTGSAAVYTVTDLNPGDGDDGVDTVTDVEVLQFADTAIDLPYFLVGGFSADVLTGGSQGDSLIGAAAADVLSGLGGDDLLDGGGQADILTGGTGNDVFVYDLASDSDLLDTDSVTDFTSGQDKIQYAGMAGVTFNAVPFAFTTDVATTVAAIQADAGITDSIVYFTDGVDGYLTVKGAGTGTSFDGSLIRLSGVTTIVSATDIIAGALPAGSAPFVEIGAESPVIALQNEFFSTTSDFGETDGDAVTFNVTGLPAGLSFTSTTTLNIVTISGTPTTTGTFTVSVTASDPQGSATDTFVLAVDPQGPPPFFSGSGAYTFQSGVDEFVAGLDPVGTTTNTITLNGIAEPGDSISTLTGNFSFVLDNLGNTVDAISVNNVQGGTGADTVSLFGDITDPTGIFNGLGAGDTIINNTRLTAQSDLTGAAIVNNASIAVLDSTITTTFSTTFTQAMSAELQVVSIAGSSLLRINGPVTNNGLIELQALSGGVSSFLNTNPGGSLSNFGLFVSSGQGATQPNGFQGDFTLMPGAQIDVRHDLLFNNQAANVVDLRNGFVDIDAGQTFEIQDGSVVLNDNSKIDGPGIFLLDGSFGTTILIDGTLTYGEAGVRFDVTGNGLVINSFNVTDLFVIPQGEQLNFTGFVDILTDLTNAGELTVSGANISSPVFLNLSGATFILDQGLTTLANPFTNSGTVVLDDTSGIGAPATFNVPGSFTNDGTIIVRDTGGGLGVGAHSIGTGSEGPLINNAGARLILDTNLLLPSTGVAHINNGLIELNGTELRVQNAASFTNGGTITGAGVIDVSAITGSTLVQNGILDPEPATTTTSTATIVVTGNVLQGASGSIELDAFGPGSFDNIITSGTFTVDGFLNLDFQPGHGLVNGSVLNGLLSSGTLDSTLNFVITHNLSAGYSLIPTYNPTDLSLLISDAGMTDFSIASGSFDAGSVWNSGVVPGLTDNVRVGNADVLTLTPAGPLTITLNSLALEGTADLTIGANGTLQLLTNSTTALGTLFTLDAGGVLEADTSLLLDGNLTWLGGQLTDANPADPVSSLVLNRGTIDIDVSGSPLLDTELRNEGNFNFDALSGFLASTLPGTGFVTNFGTMNFTRSPGVAVDVFNQPEGVITISEGIPVVNTTTFSANLVNDGLINVINTDLTSTRTVTLDISAGTFVNNGTLNFDDFGGGGTRVVEVGIGATLLSPGIINIPYSATINNTTGFVLDTRNGGSINVAAGQTLTLSDNVTLAVDQTSDITGTGSIVFTQAPTLEITGFFDIRIADFNLATGAGVSTITGAGSMLSIEPGASLTLDTADVITSSVFVENEGTLNLTGDGISIQGGFENDFGATLNITGGVTTTNSKVFETSIINDGTIVLDVTTGTFNRIEVNDFGAPGTLTNFGVFQNSGTSGASPNVFRGILDNRGVLNVDYDLDLNEDASPVTQVNNGLISIGSGQTLFLASGNTLLNAPFGTIEGFGIVDVSASPLFDMQGILSPGGSGFGGTLSIVGNTSFAGSGEVNIELGGTAPGAFDVLALDTAALRGRLKVSTINAFTPVTGNTFIILTATALGLLGSFDTVDGLDFDPTDSAVLDIDFLASPDQVVLTVVNVDVAGTTGSDFLTGTGSQVIVAGPGDDDIDITGGLNNIVYGGDGDDLIIGQGAKRIDGGPGVDVVRTSADMDLIGTPGHVFERIEVFDIDNGTAQLLQFDADSIFRIVDGANDLTAINNSLVVNGDSVDLIVLLGDFLENGERFIDVNGTAKHFTVFTEGNVSLLVDDLVELEIQLTDGSVARYGSFQSEFLTGTGLNDKIHGRFGDDTLDGQGGSDILEGGEGNDRLYYDPADLLVDGGSEVDTLDLSLAGALINLTGVTNVTNFERVDLSNGSAQTLQLDIADVLNLSGDNSLDTFLPDGRPKLLIDGDATDTVVLNGQDLSNIVGNSLLGGVTSTFTPVDLLGDGEMYILFTDSTNSIDLYVHTSLVDPDPVG